MKTAYKFILKSYLGPMVATFFIVMFVLLMQFMWRYVDELVGKGIDLNVIFELLMYAAFTLIPMGLPLATLLAAIMTMGNLGENYELLALKSAGMSLPKIMRPLIWVVLLVSLMSFFVANNLVPYSTKKIYALLYDIRQQKQTIEFKDGIFFNGIENMSIRVSKQDKEGGLLHNVIIYDTRSSDGNMTTTVADSGYIKLSDDKKFLNVTLYNGEIYEQTRNYKWYDNSTFKRNRFLEQTGNIPLSGYDFERTNSEAFNSSSTKNIKELEEGIDSLSVLATSSHSRYYSPFLNGIVFVHEQSLSQDSIEYDREYRVKTSYYQQIDSLDDKKKRDLYSEALSLAGSSQGYMFFDEDNSKEDLNQLYRFKVEWHRKMSLPISILIFFLIGAPLGAIIRKGGLGMPIVVSVLFFVIYYIVAITGEKMAREGTWVTFYGMWLSTFILLPISMFLTYKASNDSALFDSERYINPIRRVTKIIKTLYVLFQ